MDLTLKITFDPKDGCDALLARCWLAEQIRYFTGLPITGYANALHPAASFHITELTYVDTE
ncbi:hypothetical protein EDD96_4536 [Streptomyces sp. Ag109_G2-6]|uniref:hypothetical protein n=1 Tax=Streptomyces TaxID=1883 RepID=UPI0009A51ABD|nr:MULTISPECIES: hypothetical protein [Streptomyces]RPF40759.1 hypothetical protein EDD96_4536 [Streptomyces sp. Ag109_G2-6]